MMLRIRFVSRFTRVQNLAVELQPFNMRYDHGWNGVAKTTLDDSSDGVLPDKNAAIDAGARSTQKISGSIEEN